MLKKNILDSEYLENEMNYLDASMYWWEKRRLAFNLILICTEILMISFFWKGTLQFGIWNTIFWTITYTIAANIFYSTAWVLSALIQYYKLTFLKKIDKFKMLFFIAGILFSILVTIFLFKDVLYYYQIQYLWNR